MLISSSSSWMVCPSLLFMYISITCNNFVVVSHRLLPQYNNDNNLNNYISQQVQTIRSDHTQRILHQIEESHVQLSIATTGTGSTSHRELQSTTFSPTATPIPICLMEDSTTSINFDATDTFNINIFDSNLFDTTCTCVEGNNRNEIFNQVNSLDVNNVTGWLMGFNTLIGDLESSSNYSCSNSCDSCFISSSGTSTCGLISTSQSTSVQNRPGNFTFEQIAANSITQDDIIALIDTAVFYSTECIVYTSPEQYLNDELCFIIDFDGIPSVSDTLICNITYNNVLCNSCIVPALSASSNATRGSDCVIADCTNIDSNAMIDSCNNAGLVGPFEYLGLDNSNIDDTTFTIGNVGMCKNDTVVNTMAPALVPATAAPGIVQTPTISMIPSSAPVSADSNTTTVQPVVAPAALSPATAPLANVLTSTSTLVFPTITSFCQILVSMLVVWVGMTTIVAII